MAKRLIDWTLVESELVMAEYKGVDVPSVEIENFDLELLFEGSETGFIGLSDVQKHLFEYGLKQKLADAGSSEKDPKEKAKIAREKFDLFVSGKTSAVRVNSTGAKANKVLAEKVKSLTSVISLEGLMMKKMMSVGEFTEEDQVKLDEFLQMQAEFAKKESKKKG